MKKIFNRIVSIVILFIITIVSNASAIKSEDIDTNYNNKTKQDLLVLMLAYPEYIKSLEKDTEGFIYLVMKSGKKIIYDDKLVKNYEQKIFKADIQDTLEDLYPLDSINEVREENRDPGRFRVYGFLNEVYGSGEAGVKKNLSNFSTNYGNLLFNKANNAGDNLKKSLDEAANLAKSEPRVGGFVYPTCGTFNYRVVQDTGLLSPHSYGIAIDLNKNDSDYWKWVNKEKGSKRIAEYPKELVKIFENNGFVWGGKWAHFDILHFEYRPEIILKAKYFGDKDNNNSNWSEGAPVDEETNKTIDMIDKIIN
ncbi:MAG: M15 family metallopeptidase [Clostridium sp.]